MYCALNPSFPPGNHLIWKLLVMRHQNTLTSSSFDYKSEMVQILSFIMFRMWLHYILPMVAALGHKFIKCSEISQTLVLAL